MTDLYLRSPLPASSGSVDLWLGDPGTAPSTEHAVTAGGELPGLAGHVSAARGRSVAAGGSVGLLLAGLGLGVDVDINVPRGIGAQCHSPWRGAGRVDAAAGGDFTARPAVGGAARSQWRAAVGSGADAATAWRSSGGAAGAAAVQWTDARSTGQTVTAGWRQLSRVAALLGDHYADADRAAGGGLLLWQYLPRADLWLRTGWQTADRPAVEAMGAWRRAGRGAADRLSRWRDAVYPRAASFYPPVPVPAPTPVPRPLLGSPVDLRLCRRIDPDDWGALALWLGRPACLPAIPLRRIYYVPTTYSLVRAADGAPIPCAGMAFEVDADTGIIRASASLLGPDVLGLLEPLADDEPVELVADINGVHWRWLADGWTEEIRHGRVTRQLSGYSLSALLDAPYVLPRDRTASVAATVRQLADGELAEWSDWLIDDWRAADWLVPAGVWTLAAATPLAAITQLAQSAGGVVVPSRTARRLSVLPRYPVLPWAYQDAAPDLIVPGGAGVTVLSRRSTRPPQAEAVYLGGGEADGLLARVRRTGTAGATLASTVLDPLLTHADGLRARGARELAALWRQPAVSSFELPLGADFPLVELGQLLDIDGARGIVSAHRVSLESQGSAYRVRQRVTLGEDTGSVARRWRALVASDPLLAGVVTAATGADGRVTVALLGGGTIRPRGAAAIGESVYVRGDVLAGAAPVYSAALEIEV
ncbi:hypothetical protein [Plasticicumulans acidivorans]|uniref:Uncharacterized protein n=1 Tax=Plasticicumulans acidivorans TaxID=886464 RepID=A0A317N0A0_9GAMM|nr:hypothetical protein [Plasticicumulans acidivorans]PWV65992.1 hypothetical protein C7443_101480 [Plasticicumulans acidivorans]